MPEYRTEQEYAYLENRVKYLEKQLEVAKMDWLDEMAKAALPPLVAEASGELWPEQAAKNAYKVAEAMWHVKTGRGVGGHASDCAVHNAPAYPNGPCDCGRGS